MLFILAGCGGGTPKKAADSTTKKTEQSTVPAGQGTLPPVKVTLVGGSVGGSWSAVGEGIGEAIRRVAPNSSFGYQPGQDGANAVTVATGQAEAGLVFATMAKAAYEGTTPYQQKYENLRAIGQFAPYTYYILATEKSGIKTYADMKKRPVIIGVNTKDSTMELCVRTMLQEHGITYQDIEKAGGKVLYLASGPILDMMKDGRADARGGAGGIPEAKVTEAALTTGLVMVQPDPEALKRAINKLGVTPNVIPKGTYSFMKEDLPSFDINTVLICTKDLPDQVAYTMAKALIEQLPYLKTVHASLKNDTPQTIIKAPIPLHPGAEKYYREKGLL